MKHIRIVVALLSIFLVINAEALAVNPQNHDLFAGKATSSAVMAANGLYAGVQPTPAQLRLIADNLDRFTTAAEKDGSLKVYEKQLQSKLYQLTDTAFVESHAKALHASLKANGWQGTKADVASMLARLNPDQRVKLVNEIKEHGLKPTLQNAALGLRTFASAIETAQARGPHLTYASYTYSLIPVVMPNPAQCSTLMGSFLAIAAIGAVASLGGVNPLGDLLGAIGAVGAFVTWAVCP